MKTAHQVSTFGTIYHKALQSQLKKMGSRLMALRIARREHITSVAAAINLRPDVLERIENGEQDIRIKTLFTLCGYYEIDPELLIGQGELLHFEIER